MPSFQPERLAVVSLWATDVVATAHFYRDVVGLSLLPDHGHQPAFELGHGAHLVLNEGQPEAVLDSKRSRFPTVSFGVRDLDKAVEHLADHGVELPWGVEESGGARWVIFNDPAGNLVEFVQFEEPPES
jgi:catechol 2,3-dioxygenase-like lactoylglutathione lyase family enzyme